MGETYHIPVLRDEVLSYLQVWEGGTYVDCTLGGGGHAEAILERGGRVIGIDRDAAAVGFAMNRLKRFGERFKAEQARFSEVRAVVGIHSGAIDGVLMDLGVSSRMIDDPDRGFSYLHDGPLSMAMGLSCHDAGEIVNTWDSSRLTGIFREYGEERHARKIADAIVCARTVRPIGTTGELANLVERTVGGKLPQKSKARVFQALRIAVNEELDELKNALAGVLEVLRSGGRLCVISYHSLEDRIVKDYLGRLANPCLCPPDLPVCRCGRVPKVTLVTRKPIRATEKEVKKNPRARSALLRVAEKLEEAERA